VQAADGVGEVALQRKGANRAPAEPPTKLIGARLAGVTGSIPVASRSTHDRGRDHAAAHSIGAA
jgi:hypothetical protein